MKQDLPNPLLALSALAMSVCSANAAALVHEPFGMATGDLSGTSSPGSSGLSGTWTTNNLDDSQVVSGSLSYGSLTTSGNSLATTAQNGGTSGRITTTSVLADNNLLDDGETLWFSIIIDGNVTSNAHSGFSFGTAGVAGKFNGVQMQDTGSGFGLYYQGSTFRAAYWEAGSTVDSSDARSSNTSFTDAGPSLIVGELIWGAGGETLNLYTPSSGDLSTPGSIVSSITSSSNIDQSLFNTISYSSRGSAGGDSFDEIRFGASYADVVPIPEPSAGLLGGLGLLALLRRRR